MKTNSPLGFSMPHSPLNQNDSIAAVKAWDKMKSGYMNRSQNTPEYNKKEWDMEKNEFYYDTNRNKLRLVPTDDGEIPIKGFKEGLEKWQLPPQKSPLSRHHGTYKVGDRLSDKDVHNYEAKFHGLASAGRSLTAEDVSDIQEDEHGQYVTWEKEITRGKDRGEKVIDTIRPVKKTAGGLFNAKYPDGYHTFKKN